MGHYYSEMRDEAEHQERLRGIEASRKETTKILEEKIEKHGLARGIVEFLAHNDPQWWPK